MFLGLENLSIVIPVYNEDHKTVEMLSSKLRDFGAEVIVVDDGSFSPIVGAIRHEKNIGYGQAILTGVQNTSNNTVLVMDGDGQHSVGDVLKMYTVWGLIDGIDMLIGARRLKYEKFIRMLGRKFLNFIASFIALYWLNDLNSGMRIFKKNLVLGYSPILCKEFSFTTSLTMSMLCDGYMVEWFPIKVSERKNGKSKVKIIRHGFITLYYILRIGFALRTRGIRKWLRSLKTVQT